MSAIAGIVACVLASSMYIRAPIPPEPPPDPMSRGYLGISIQTGGLGIDLIEPNSPAAKAGLEAGDVIVRIGTLEPRESTQVVSHICSFRPGALVEIEVRRGAQHKTYKVKLASRPLKLDIPLRPFPDFAEDEW